MINRRYYVYFLLLLIGLIQSCGGSSEPEGDETPLLSNCRITEYTNEFDIRMQFSYNDQKLVQEIRYEVAEFTGIVNLEYDDMDRLVKLTSPSTTYTLVYTPAAIEINYEYANERENGGSGLIIGPGKAFYNLDGEGKVTSIVKNDQQRVKIEYNENDQVNRVLLGPVGSEILYAEIETYDANPNPFESLPRSFWVGEDRDGMRNVFWDFSPYESANNATRTVIYTSSTTSETAVTYEYNDLGYPIASSTSYRQSFTYFCE